MPFLKLSRSKNTLNSYQTQSVYILKPYGLNICRNLLESHILERTHAFQVVQGYMLFVKTLLTHRQIYKRPVLALPFLTLDFCLDAVSFFARVSFGWIISSAPMETFLVLTAPSTLSFLRTRFPCTSVFPPEICFLEIGSLSLESRFLLPIIPSLSEVHEKKYPQKRITVIYIILKQINKDLLDGILLSPER